jgi:hypothetical protein
MDKLTINTRTTGFGSPARAYAKKRLDLNDLLVQNVYTTYYFKWEGDAKFGLETGDTLIIDRSLIPQPDDLVLYSGQEKIHLDYYKNIESEKLWGVVTWKLSQLRK